MSDGSSKHPLLLPSKPDSGVSGDNPNVPQLSDLPLEARYEQKTTLLFKGLKNKRQRAFLAAFATCHDIHRAAKIAHIHWSNHYLWLKKDPDYPAHFEFAKEVACDRSEDEVWRRGFQGVNVPITYKGVITASYKEYSDDLAKFYLMGNREKYKTNAGFQFTGPTQINVTIGKAEPRRIESGSGGNSGGVLSRDTGREGTE